MNLGEKLINLRKNLHLSQEDVADKLNVTRQTVSNWECNQTTPDLNQAKQLSKLYKVSLDELTDNDIQGILVEKVSNTEKLAGMTIKILKWIGALILGFLILGITCIVIFNVYNKQPEGKMTEQSLECTINDTTYKINIDKSGYTCDKCDKQMRVFINDITDWANVEHSTENVKKYFSQQGGTCKNS